MGLMERQKAFQSTLPAWGETLSRSHVPPNRIISIHSPRMGRDQGQEWSMDSRDLFQSTLPAWGETQGIERIFGARLISIHSPRMGRDCERPGQWRGHRWHFNPLSPHGERLAPQGAVPTPCHFNPLSPHGERPRRRCSAARGRPHFNPLSPHGERRGRGLRGSTPTAFQSTLPAWGETGSAPRPSYRSCISIHSPRMGRDARV